MLLIALSVVSLLGRLALVALAARELFNACTLPGGRLRRRHVAFGTAAIVGALIRF